MVASQTATVQPLTRSVGLFDWLAALRQAQGVSWHQRGVAMTLATYADTETGESIRPSLARLAEQTGESRTRLVATVGELVDMGWLTVVYDGAQARKPSVYRLSVPVTVAGTDVAVRDMPAPETRPRSGPGMSRSATWACRAPRHDLLTTPTQIDTFQRDAAHRAAKPTSSPEQTIHHPDAYQAGVRRHEDAHALLRDAIDEAGPHLAVANYSLLEWAARREDDSSSRTGKAPLGRLRVPVVLLRRQGHDDQVIASRVVDALVDTEPDPADGGDSAYKLSGPYLGDWMTAAAARHLTSIPAAAAG